ncbi:MAG: SRPBCC domain-containing protein [Labilithrix sp.]|nr:SRPBCC domain-containing protein [Labilithrix sp.]MCW5812684.1 SRPBCC domain-containing protein [Labilithrix sp.]
MTKKETGASGTDVVKRRITIERTYRATLDEVWELWATKEGIESWWGPGGFRVTVRTLDLRPGGELRYAMTAVEPAQVAFMAQAGMPLTQELRITYSEVQPRRRLAYVHLADFIPGVDPYDVATVVEFHPSPDGVRLVLTFDAMHEEEWTNRATLGWKGELNKLAEVLGA